MAMWRVELGEHDLDKELLHLLLVDWLLKEDVRHSPDHVQGPVLLAGGGAGSISFLFLHAE